MASTLNGAQAILADHMSEDDLLESVAATLTTFGWIWFHDTDSKRNHAGLPDIVAVRRGRVLFAELKSSTGRVRIEQRSWLDALADTAAEVYVWRPRDWHAGTIEEVLT